MARKKTTPVEETEQLQTSEVLEQAGLPPEDDGLPPEFSDAAPPDAAVPGEDPSEPAVEAEDAPPGGDEAEASDPSSVGQAQDTPVLDLTDTGQTEDAAPPDSPDPAEDESRDEPVEVMSVDLSEPVAPPDSSANSPEDLDSLLEDPGEPRPAVPQTMPLMPAEDAAEEEMPPDPPAPEKSDRQKFFELKFNRLDRNLTPEERQEWNSIYASYRGRSALTGTIIGVDPFSVQVRNPETGAMEKQTMYCAIVVPYRVRIVIPASEMWEKDKERPDFVLQNMVGSTIDFIIIKVDREAGFAIGSRRLASRSQRYFFARRPNLNAVGTRLKCRMLSVGPRRCLVECYGHDVGLTQRELRYTAIPDLRDEYHPGQELDCIVKLYDPDAGRLELSVKETESNPFDGAEQRHPVGARRLAVIAGKYGGGVFCNLPDGAVCMCNYSYQHEDSDFLVGDNVMLIVQRYENEKRQMYGKILTKW